MPTYRVVKGSENFPRHVVDEKGLPHDELTLYACKAPEHHSARTAQTYVRELIAFATWSASDKIALRQGWSILGGCTEVRALVTHFLTIELNCIVALRQDKLGFETRRVEAKWGAKRNLGHLLAALGSFYKVLHRLGRYGPENPMQGDDAARVIHDERKKALESFIRQRGRAPMPGASGIDNAAVRKSTSSYFRASAGNWLPEVIDEPDLKNRVLSAGERWGWSYRESALARILFDTGCRIHEACAISVGDWQLSGFSREIRTINKGSMGRRTKTLYVSDRTVKVLRSYLIDERSRLDSRSANLKELLEMKADIALATPLFITVRGTSMTADYFRSRFWTPALAANGIKLRPHQVRHWFVTMALNEIEDISKSPEELAKARLNLRDLMSWRSDMLPVYDQVFRNRKLPELAAQIHARIDAKQVESIIASVSVESTSQQVRSQAQIMLEKMLTAEQ